MQQKIIDSIALIIIDQLRIDYADFMPLCSNLLPFCIPCDTKSYPSSTEPTHATLSTATPPGVHGFISKQTRVGETGLSELEDKFDSGEVIPIALAAKENGFYTYVIGGKPETVQVMGRKEDCSLRVFYQRGIDESKFKVDGTDENKIELLMNMLKNERKNTLLSRAEQDIKILNFLNTIMSDKKRLNNLYITCLPGLDEIGHIYGPKSQAIKEHLTSLDEKLDSIISKHKKDTSFIVTGDHGCRNISRYVIEIEDESMTMAVYKKANDKLNFVERYCIESKDEIYKIEYDGGNLRVWFKSEQGHLTSNDKSFFLKYGEIQPVHNKGKEELYRNSNHPNQGDITIIAHDNTMFCKEDWIKDEDVIRRISNSVDLSNGDLPRGEHGTHHDEDRIVAFLSDYNFGVKRITNIMIPNFIKQLMGQEGDIQDIMFP